MNEQIKHLENLKVKAIAVSVPYGSNRICILQNRYLSFRKPEESVFEYIALPPGEWVIIGRADIGETAHVFGMDYEDWQSYYNVHNLTNELILCEL